MLRHLFMLLVLVVALTGCGAPPAPNSGRAFYTYNGLPAGVAVDRVDYDELAVAWRNLDSRTLNRAMETGDLLTVQSGTPVTVLSFEGGLSHVEFLAGEQAGRRGYVASVQLRP